jgi:prepilin-type N-terminal cleavage/methylation domain-containing protein
MKGQKGFTLVELVVTTAVTGVIVSFLGFAVYQILNVTGFGNSRLTAAHELENAAYWFNHDGQEAASAAGGGSLALTLSDNSSVSYSLSGAELRRSAGGASMTLARNISSLTFFVSGRVVIMSLTSTLDSASENGTYQVYLRPSGAG